MQTQAGGWRGWRACSRFWLEVKWQLQLWLKWQLELELELEWNLGGL